MTAVLQIRLFGGLDIRCGGVPVGGFVSNKAPALLAYLAVTGRPQQRETLAALLWGEMADADAKNNLRQTLTSLRKVMDSAVLVTRDTVAWNPAVACTLDTAQFEAHLQAGRDVSAGVRAGAFQQAAALYHGDFLAGVIVREAPAFEEWLLAQRARYRELALHTLHALTEHHLSRGEYGRAIDGATRLLALDAWREEAYRQLMLALARSGQRSAALAQYEVCRHLLNAELGVPPSAETTALYERIRAAGDMPPHNLPPQATLFVGRTEELTQIEELLQTPNARLLTVVGPGGIGKTRLALQAAAQAHRRGLFLHGVFFVPLEGIDSPLLLATAVAQAMGLQFSGSQEPTAQLLVYLQAREILLVLDNLEHLAEADAWAGRLLHACARVSLLVTSRKRLNLHGERLLELSGLAVPAGVTEWDVTRYSAAQLFLNSAQHVQPDFTVTHETRQVIGRICRLVNGLPLAIELAAAWVRHLDCHEIADEIERNLGFLATTQANVPARHRSLQAAFEHSWALLDDDERRAFARMALFRGGFDRAAALTVTQCRFPIFVALCDKSLLRRDPSGRYALHELLRQYAEIKLQAEPQAFAEAQARHGQHYVQFLAGREDAQNDARQHEAQREIATEMDNIRAAWGWAIARHQPDALEPALESLRVFFEHAGWYMEAVRLFEAAAACTTAGTPLYGKLLVRQAWFYHRFDRFEQARALIAESLAIFRTAQPPLPAEEALCLQCLGNMARVVGDFPQAILYATQSLALFRVAGNSRAIAASLNTLAVVHAERGEFAEAHRLHEECLALKREIGDRRGVAISLVNLGYVALAQADYARAKPLEAEALAIFREIGYPMGVAVALNNLGFVCSMLAEHDAANAFLQECVEICRELGHRHIAAHALGSLGNLAGARGDYRKAWHDIREALHTAQEIGSVSATLFGLLCVALLLARQGESERATEVSALVFHHSATNRDSKSRAEQLLARLETQLPAPLWTAAQARGQTKPLEAVVTEILELDPRSHGDYTR